MKTCPKCKTVLPDDAVFCNECGTPLANNAAGSTPDAAQNTAPAANPFPPASAPDGNAAGAAPKKINNTMIGIIAIAAVLLIAVVIFIISALGAYKKPINTLVGLVNKRSTNVTAYLDCVSPSFVGSSYKSLLGTLKGGDAKKELDEQIKDMFEDIWDEFEDDYGKNWRITVQWRDADKLSNKKLKDVQERWEELADALKDMDLDDEDNYEEIADILDDEYDTTLNTAQAAKIVGKLVDQIEDAKITAGYEVDLKLSINGKSGNDSAKITVIVIKVNGRWIIDPTSGANGYDTSDLVRALRYL